MFIGWKFDPQRELYSANGEVHRYDGGIELRHCVPEKSPKRGAPLASKTIFAAPRRARRRRAAHRTATERPHNSFEGCGVDMWDAERALRLFEAKSAYSRSTGS
jgi:hypothetical protein